MGIETRRRDEKFFRENPNCCLCGGVERSTTKDHLPPASFFFGRRWPTGYVFPACEKCNNGSSMDDELAGLVAFMSANTEGDPARSAEVGKRVRAFLRKHPDQAAAMEMGSTEKRALMRDLGLAKPHGGTFRDLPILKVTEDQKRALDVVMTKIAKALHYKHANRIVPKLGVVLWEGWSSMDLVAKAIPRDVLAFEGLVPALRSQSTDVVDQFRYKVANTEDGCRSLIVAKFHRTMLVRMFVSCDPVVDLSNVGNTGRDEKVSKAA